MRVIGLDVHRSFAEVAVLDKGIIEHAGRFKLEHRRVIDFGKLLRRSDEVVLEATGNTSVIVRLLTPFVRRVVVANPLQVRAIAWAKVKTDKVDTSVLAKLHVPAGSFQKCGSQTRISRRCGGAPRSAINSCRR
jgi:hypothetical protein